MSDLKFEVDVESISREFGNMKEDLQKDLTRGVENLANMTHAKTLELARDELGSLSQKYMENVEFSNPMENFWIVTLKEPALWIEEGRKCVVYGKNSSHIPKVLTPDGEKPITEIKVGMLVLNQYGKWTRVAEVYNEHLVEKSKLSIEEIKACRYEPENKKLNKREYSLGFISTCPVCNDKKYYLKINKKKRQNSYCTKCLSRQEVYKVRISGSLNSKRKSKNWSTMYLTGDHKVMTQNGWKEIRDVDQNKDKVFIPSWSKCKSCGKDTFFGKKFCYDNEGGKCSSSYYTKQTLEKGRHQSQNPNSRSRYLQVLKKLQKSNKTEDKVEEHILNSDYTCTAWDKNEKSDFYREFPVKVKSDGKYKAKYYYLDFYNPKLKLAIEVDGESFHSHKRDSVRDLKIKEKLNCDIVRIPARQVWKKDFYHKTIDPLLKNHSNEISMMPFDSFKIEKVDLKPYSSINRRWDITVEEGESFICNKILIHNSGFMEELLNGKSAKTGKNGRYAVIPFKHNENPSQQSEKATKLADEIKQALRKRNINWRKIEKNADGSPRIGRLHTINVETARLSPKHKTEPGMGVSVYQSKDKQGNVRRDVVTFRIIHEKHRQEGLWVHPGRKGDKLMDKALDWAMNTWEKEILPMLLEKYK